VRSLSSLRLTALLLALATGAAPLVPAAEPAPKPVEIERPADGTVPTSSDINRAVKAVKADPLFSRERKISTLHWASEKERKRKGFKFPSWFDWIGTFFSFLGQSARVLVWIVIALAAGLIVIYVVRLLRRMEGGVGLGTRFVAPSHVQDLDIRPESLPPDIGAAVRELWDRGEHRAALALLYRGLLSRLVHVHQVPIRDSSTEGDCLALAARHVSEARSRYAQRLVRVWQRAVYGGETIERDTVYGLCDDFGRTLDGTPEPGIGAARGAPA
jgi:hypothetical protein